MNLVHDIPCGGTVRAKTHCDLLLLSKENVIQTMQHFPESETPEGSCNHMHNMTISTPSVNEDEE